MKKTAFLSIFFLFAIQVFAQPVIQSFLPGSGLIGSTVTITGTNFSSTPAANIVFFGAVKATVFSATSTQLNVIVPAGATYQPITVTTGNLTAYSSKPFFVTFPCDSPQMSANSFSIDGNYATGTYPADICLSDLNDDGKPDLAIVNSVGNSISILKNANAGAILSFSPKVDFATGPNPKRITIGDLDGDGHPDIVVTNFNSGNASTISVFRNTSSIGTISFAPKADYATGNGSIGLYVTDINIDGKPDIIVSSGNSGIFSIFINTNTSTGAISFAPKQDYTLLTHPDNITMADLDGDGKPDIITSNFSAASISIFRNTSTGGILSLTPGTDYSVGTNPSYVITGDLDGDDKIDVAVTNYSSANISFFKNTSSIGFISLGPRQDFNLSPTNISMADLNGDGKPDLCTGRGLSGIISILENTYTAGPNFSFGTNIDFSTGNYDTFVSAGDLDGDGKPELASVNTLLNTVSILKNRISEPVIATLSSLTGNSGSNITINGNNFTGTTSVKFGGTPANSFTLVSTTRIEAVVGGGASGVVTVTTALGTGSLAGFSFIPSISAGGPTTFCGDGFVILSSSAAANNQWYKDGIAISGATATTLQVSTSGLYTVTTTGSGITTTSPTGIAVTAITIATPVISINGNTLVSSAATGNQWYLNGTIIPAATNQTYQPAQNGNYTVKSTVNGCTSDFSTPFNFTLTGIINLGNDQYINLYPNPVKNKLYIHWNIGGIPSLNIEVFNLQGRRVLLNKNIHTGTSIDLSVFSQGVYFIRIYNAFKINETVKIIRKD